MHLFFINTRKRLGEKILSGYFKQPDNNFKKLLKWPYHNKFFLCVYKFLLYKMNRYKKQPAPNRLHSCFCFCFAFKFAFYFTQPKFGLFYYQFHLGPIELWRFFARSFVDWHWHVGAVEAYIEWEAGKVKSLLHQRTTREAEERKRDGFQQRHSHGPSQHAH